MPNFLRASSALFVLSMVPNGVSTFTWSPFFWTREWRAICHPTMPRPAIPKTIKPTMTKTTMRIVLEPLLDFAAGAMPGTDPATGMAVPDCAVAPHLGQNLSEELMLAPQELQKATLHLAKLESGTA